MLQDAFLKRIQLQLYPNRKGIYEEICFPLRWHPQNHENPHTFIEKAMGKQLNLNVEDKNFSLGINMVVSRVADKILNKFKEEMIADEFRVDQINQRGQPQDRGQTPYGVTYRWLWEKKFPRMAWDLAKEVAVPVRDQMEMIPYDQPVPDPDERVIITRIPKEETLQKGKDYRLKLNLYDTGYLLLINENVNGEKFLISPSKAYAEIPSCRLTEPLYLPPDDDKHRGPLAFDTEEELFLAIVTDKEVKLSWINEKYYNEDVSLNEQRLLEIFEKVGKMSDYKAYKRFFWIKAQAD
ncbi:hypothetical protein CAL7716_105120 (plasmid) [Calothrix sp. PCC 7716]|nr:hypothetical protein CAL7716_105120 [Calothrix sp. PCC 7716]